jgi:hypothetical protein
LADRSDLILPLDYSGHGRSQASGALPDAIDSYLEGIRRAERDGLIAYARANLDQAIVSDDYSHISRRRDASLALKYTNTRPLSFLARRIFNLYRNGPDVRFLELGPGAGAACAAVSRLRPDAQIDTVSLTPLNPYLRLRWDDMYLHIAEPSLQVESLPRFYEPCCRPFVRHQYIGRFPDEICLRPNEYHFIYEDHGAILYNFDPFRRDEAAELGRASISSALSALRPDGTMLIMASDGSYGMEDAFESMTSDTDVVVTCERTRTYHSFPCIVARGESLLAARLRESAGGSLPSSGRVLRLEASELEDVIVEVCAL